MQIGVHDGTVALTADPVDGVVVVRIQSSVLGRVRASQSTNLPCKSLVYRNLVVRFISCVYGCRHSIYKVEFTAKC